MKRSYERDRLLVFVQIIGLLLVVSLASAGDPPRLMPGWPQETDNSMWGPGEGPILGDLDGDGDLEVIIGSGRTVYAFNHDATLVPGWPAYTTYYIFGAPAMGDLEGDGTMEVVIRDRGEVRGSKLYAWHSDGSPVSGFPKSVSFATEGPTLSDLNGDGTLEIIVTGYYEINIFNHEGERFEGWPQKVDKRGGGPPSVGDVDGDEGLEVLAASGFCSAYIWHSDGTLLSGWPQSPGLEGFGNGSSFPSLADIDGDGDLEIAVGTAIIEANAPGRMYLWHHDGSMVQGWYRQTSIRIMRGAAWADVDGDGELELICPQDRGLIHVWNTDGTYQQGWPVAQYPGSAHNSPTVGDIDGDEELEILTCDDMVEIATGQGFLHVYHSDGTEIAWSPLRPVGWANVSPSLGDVDRDGLIELVFYTEDFGGPGRIYMYKLDHPYDPQRVPWPMFGHDPQHTGNYHHIIQRIAFAHRPLRDTEDTDGPYGVVAKIMAGMENAADESSLFIVYGTDGVFSDSVLITPAANPDEYSGFIPSPLEEAEIGYYFSAADTSGSVITHPPAAPQKHFGFHVGPDRIPPVISRVDSLTDTIYRSGSRQVKAVATDNIGIGRLLLYFRVNESPRGSVVMMPAGTSDEYAGLLSWEGTSVGDVVSYYVVAVDSSSQQNRAISRTHTFQIASSMLVDDFESGAGKWDLGQSWGLGWLGHNNSRSMTDSPGGDYENSSDNGLTLLEPLDLSDFEKATITYWHWYNIEPERDFGYVEASADGANWTQLDSYTGFLFPIMEGSSSLNDFCGPGFEEVHLRFRLVSDEAGTRDGWYLDDITVWVDTAVTSVDDQGEPSGAPASFSLAQNYPNPFNPTTSIQYSVISDQSPTTSSHYSVVSEQSLPHVTLKIYNILGQEVRALVDEPKEPGYYSLWWDGRDDFGREVASGVYFYRLTVNGPNDSELLRTGQWSETKKMVLLR